MQLLYTEPCCIGSVISNTGVPIVALQKVFKRVYFGCFYSAFECYGCNQKNCSGGEFSKTIKIFYEKLAVSADVPYRAAFIDVWVKNISSE